MFDDAGQILFTFFAAMQEGYAKSAKKSSIHDLPGSKTIHFELGELKVMDCYFVTPQSQHSFGQTIIWHKDVPVWTMSYQGFYPANAISFLKRALSESYNRWSFVGGRGPRLFTDEEMTYINKVELPNDWRHFRGREEIFDQNRKVVGWHEYQGLLLLEWPSIYS